MNNFRNAVLQREFQNIILNAINMERGTLGGHSIEIEIDEPKSYDSYVYNGRTAEIDRDHDFEILNKLFLEKTTE